MKRFLILLLSLAAVAAAQSCQEKDDAVTVPTAVQSSFTQLYPDAKGMKWKEHDTFLVVEFYRAGNESEAWFDAAGNWYMTQTEISFAALPEIVRQAFRTGEYGDWEIDDVEMTVRREMETVYTIKVERGREKYRLYYSEDGILLQSRPDTKDGAYDILLPQQLPQAVTDFIEQQYPGARIVEIETEHHPAYTLEVEIIDGRTAREVYFDAANRWIGTKTELQADAVPAAVMQVLRASRYGQWEIDDIDHILTLTREWYRFEMEDPQTDRDTEVDIAADGTML